MPACAREIKRQHFGLCLRDNENGTACCRELLAGSVHLAEVGIAGDSGEMPEKDQQEEFTVEEHRQLDRSAVGLEECEVRCEFASGHDVMIVANQKPKQAFRHHRTHDDTGKPFALRLAQSFIFSSKMAMLPTPL
jgi:hypothetical protein